MELSIIIPVFEERQKIAQDIMIAAEFLNKHAITGEIIIVDDGSQDDTAEVAQNTRPYAGIPVRVIRYPVHRGKGFAVRTGFNSSRGEVVMFIDSGQTVPFENVFTGLSLIKNDLCDIAHGSRKLPASTIHKSHKWLRQISSWLFQKIIRIGLPLPVNLTDTQCGLKIYRGEIGRQLYRKAKIDGFLFDIEIILRAVQQHYRIQEFPIEWTADRDSRLSLKNMPWRVLTELRRIKRILKEEKQQVV